MIDHLLAFATEAAAQADPVVGTYFIGSPGAWRSDVCIPGVFVWLPADDTTSTVTGPGGAPVSVITHQPYDSQWRIIVSLPAQDMGLTNSAACERRIARALVGAAFWASETV